MHAERLRTAFTEFFVERGHTAAAPASLIPNDPTVLFTIAGMVPFKAYFTGEAPAPYPRATTIQPCLRTSDIEIISFLKPEPEFSRHAKEPAETQRRISGNGALAR